MRAEAAHAVVRVQMLEPDEAVDEFDDVGRELLPSLFREVELTRRRHRVGSELTASQ